MGVLRIREQIEALLEEDPYKDPYEILSFDEPHRPARSPHSQIWSAVVAGVVAAVGIAAGTFYAMQRSGDDLASQPFAYFEIKAIDPDGRPVAGAMVKNGDAQLGVTDSFGEWRRFMRVKLGSTVTLNLTKKATGGTLTALKNMAVPLAMPEAGELELSGSVQLAKAGQKNQKQKKQMIDVAQEQRSEPAPEPAGESTPHEAAPARDLSTVWFMAASNGASSAKVQEVVNALRRRSRELGLRIDPASPLRITLRALETTGASAGESLVQVDAHYEQGGNSERIFTFLRNLQESALLTARDVLWSATQHVRIEHKVSRQGDEWLLSPAAQQLWSLAPGRTVEDESGRVHTVQESTHTPGLFKLSASDGAPCNAAACKVVTRGVQQHAPVAGWQRLKLQILGRMDNDLLVYVSGYQAYRAPNGIFEYWGQPQGAANLTIVSGGKIAYRNRLQAAREQPPVISLPSAPISKL